MAAKQTDEVEIRDKTPHHRNAEPPLKGKPEISHNKKHAILQHRVACFYYNSTVFPRGTE